MAVDQNKVDSDRRKGRLFIGGAVGDRIIVKNGDRRVIAGLEGAEPISPKPIRAAGRAVIL